MRTLTKEGFSVRAAAGGEEGLALVRERAPQDSTLEGETVRIVQKGSFSHDRLAREVRRAVVAQLAPTKPAVSG